ncbi:MAG TPA: DNA gyrase inhibitor YacG [Steroidobacteraceae bacterium]
MRCPTCQRPIEWTDAFPFRPFCSERCRLIDLGAWLTERHAIPGEPAQPEEEAGSATGGSEPPP